MENMRFGDYDIAPLRSCTFQWTVNGFQLIGKAPQFITLHHVPTTTLTTIETHSGEILFSRAEPNHSPNVIPYYAFHAACIPNTATSLFFIPSILDISNPTLRRASISAQRRFEQTLEQVVSIRTRYPDAIIVLQEMSVHVASSYIDALAPHCTWIVRYDTDADAYKYIHESANNKGLGEMYVTRHLLRSVQHHSGLKHVIKFGGRYALQDTFSLERVCKPTPTFSGLRVGVLYKYLVYSVMYGLPVEYIESFCAMLTAQLLDGTLSIERAYTAWVMDLPSYHPVTAFGIRGLCVGTSKVITL